MAKKARKELFPEYNEKNKHIFDEIWEMLDWKE